SAAGPVIARAGLTLGEGGASDALDDSALFDAGPLALRNVDVGAQGDLRGAAFDPRPGVDLAYLLSRSPTALLIGTRVASSAAGLSATFAVRRPVAVGAGPSDLELVELATSSGPRLFAFITCYDARSIYIVDVDLGRVA